MFTNKNWFVWFNKYFSYLAALIAEKVHPPYYALLHCILQKFYFGKSIALYPKILKFLSREKMEN